MPIIHRFEKGQNVVRSNMNGTKVGLNETLIDAT
jgi:hypothetical protein